MMRRSRESRRSYYECIARKNHIDEMVKVKYYYSGTMTLRSVKLEEKKGQLP